MFGTAAVTSAFSENSVFIHPHGYARVICVLKNFHSRERFQKFAISVGVFIGYVWKESQSAKKKITFSNEFIRIHVDGPSRLVYTYDASTSIRTSTIYKPRVNRDDAGTSARNSWSALLFLVLVLASSLFTRGL